MTSVLFSLQLPQHKASHENKSCKFQCGEQVRYLQLINYADFSAEML